MLFHCDSAQDFQLLSPKYGKAELKNVMFNVQQVLRRRGHAGAADVLTTVEFEVWEATNSFSDEFSVLYAEVPLDRYESLRGGGVAGNSDFAQVAEVLTELGTFIRFIACERYYPREIH